MSVEKDLRKLVGLVRHQPADDRLVGTFRVPQDFTDTLGIYISITPPIQERMNQVEHSLRDDLRFERLSQTQIRESIQWLVCASLADRNSRPDEDFITRHASGIVEMSAWYSVTYLAVETPLAIGNVTIIPIEEEIRKLIPDDVWDERTRSMAITPVVGTNEGKMIIRARQQVRSALTSLRAALPGKLNMFSDVQLRFDTGEACGWLNDERPWRWYRSSNHVDLTLPTVVIDHIDGDQLALKGISSRIAKQFEIAFGWLDRARMTDDMLIRLLFLFSALEAILGDMSEGLKAQRLAFTEALLTLTQEGSFPHPSRLYFLYNDVRSYAVHGNLTFDIDDNEVSALDRRVHNAIWHYLSIVRRERITSPKGFQDWLNHHDQAPELVEWLKTNDPDNWQDFGWPPTRVKDAR